MRSFRQFIQLMEGGEKAIFHKEPGKIGLSSPGWKETLAAGNGLASSKIPVSTREDAEKSIRAIGDHFKKHHGVDLFGPGHKALDTGNAYAGSSKPIMQRHANGKHVYSETELAKMGKKKSGDHDVLFNEKHKAHITPENLNKELVGKDLGEHVVHGVAKSGNQTHIALRHKKTGEIHQVDLVPEKYKVNEPDTWSQISHASHPEDLRNGVSGAARAAMLSSVAHGVGEHPHPGPEVSGKTGKASKNQPAEKGLHTVGSFGLRDRYEEHPSGNGVSRTTPDHSSNTRSLPKIAKRLDLPENAVGHFTNTVSDMKGWHPKRLDRTLRHFAKGMKDLGGSPNDPAHKHIRREFVGHPHAHIVRDALS